MAKTASFVIEINGVKESISAVDSLNKSLDTLEQRIDALAKKNVNVSTSGGDTTARTKALEEEDRLLRQIDQLHQKVADTEKQEYQELLHAKAELKEYQTIAKSIAAQTNLDQGINNTNTMAGMKAQLHDIKAAMQTIDVDSDKFKQLQQEANELNNKLKEIEQGYGVFSRSVGNYANGVADGLQKVVIKVGETERTFESAREASRTLNNELKNMAVNGQQGTKEYDELNDAVKQLNSTLKDIEVSSAAMDNLLDTMQGITALASMSEGLSALFGLDNSAIEESIQKLVALQNVLQGLETIRKQMQTQEGIGLLLSKGNAAVDAFAASLLKVDKGAAAASKSVKLLSTSLKLLGGAGIAAAIIAISVALDKMKKKLDEINKKADESAKYTQAGAEAYAKAKVEIDQLVSKIDTFKGSLSQERKLVEDINSKLNTHYKTLADVRKNKANLINLGEQYCKMLEQEAIAQAAAAQYAQAYAQSMANAAKIAYLNGQIQEGFFKGWNNAEIVQQVRDLEKANDELKEIQTTSQEVLKNATKNASEIRNTYGFNQETTKKIKDNSKKVEDAVRQAENNINALRLRLMNDGLLKQLMQLDDNNRKEIAAIKKNGQKVEEQLKLQSQVYNKERKKIIDDYIKNINESIKGLNLKILEDDIVEVQNLNEVLKESKTLIMDFSDSEGVRNSLAKMAKDLGEAWKAMDFDKAVNFEGLRLDANATNQFDDYFKFLLGYLKEQGEEVQKTYLDIFDKAYKEALESGYSDEAATKTAQLKMFGELETFFKNTYQYEMKLIDKYGVNVMEAILEGNDGDVLEISLQQRLDNIDHYYNTIGNRIVSNIREIEAKRKELLDKQELDELEKAGEDRDRQLQNPDEAIYKDDYEAILKANAKVLEEYEKKRAEITLRYANERKKLEIDTARDISLEYSEYYDKMLTSYMDFQSTLNNLVGKQPVMNSWEIVNIGKTKKQLKEAENAVKTFKDNIIGQLSSLEENYADGLITPEVYTSTKRRLIDIETSVDETSEQIQNKMKRLPADFMQSIQQYIQAVGQAATQVIQSIGQINDAAFEKQMEALNDETDALKDQLEYQKEITQKYADDIDDIESELSDSRGDRRQFLIDQLNAQMEAQRQSLAQEKQIEKEQERIDRRKKNLEYQNDMRKWEQSKLTAAINAALAISNAAVNNWPIPAIPMMALATAAGAAQMAAVMAAKPKKYAKGGLLEGPSHNQGGIRAGNVELEGNEYVVNKQTAMQNLPLMNFINSRKKRIDLDDIVEFYSTGIKKNVSITNKTKFADGGMLPTLRSDVDLEGNVLRAIEKYNERNVVVSVVDIINKSDNVRQVQTMAGLK